MEINCNHFGYKKKINPNEYECQICGTIITKKKEQ